MHVHLHFRVKLVQTTLNQKCHAIQNAQEIWDTARWSLYKMQGVVNAVMNLSLQQSKEDSGNIQITHY